MNGVIAKATHPTATEGDLLRAGKCNFDNDGSFNAATEQIVTNAPSPPKTIKDPMHAVHHRWTGSDWIEV